MTSPTPQQSGISRRTLLTGAAGLQLGLFVSASGARRFLAPLGPDGRPRGVFAQDGADPVRLTAYVHIGEDGSVTLAAPVPDIGQGVRTSLAMLVAEELDAPWERVTVSQAPAGAEFGRQSIGGSGTMRSYYTPLRRAGAVARAMLVATAAQRWGVPAGECHTEEGVVHHAASGRSLEYGALASEAGTRDAPAEASVPLKSVADFRLIGSDVRRVDNADVVTGAAIYGLDARPELPQGERLTFAVVARPPALGARLQGFDGAAARAVPGVLGVVEGVAGGVAVVAESTWAALSGREALAPQWQEGPNAALDSASIRTALEAGIRAPAPPSDAAATAEASFDLPYLAHATMEPMNCTVRRDGDTCTVWVPTQSPQGVRRTVARGLGLPESAVEVRPTLAGGGFGRRASTDYAREAAAIVAAVGGTVQLLWTRDDDLRHDAYRPASHHRLAGGMDAGGRVTSFAHQMAIASGSGREDAMTLATRRAASPDGTQQRGGGGPYDIPGFGVQRSRVNLPVPTFVWRSVDHSQVTFANESFLDILAAAAGEDPVALRRRHLSEPRLAALLERAAAGIGWGRDTELGTGLGIACFAGYGSFVAQAVEVHVSPEGAVRVERVYCAVDCGVAVNPSSIRAQMEGCVSDAVATTLFAEITLSEGAIEQEGFWSYRWTRMGDMPRVEVEIVESTANPGGMGELGYPAVSPAICNAIFDATGRRITRLPLREEDLAGWADDITTPGATPTAIPEPTPGATQAPEPAGGRIFMPRVVDES